MEIRVENLSKRFHNFVALNLAGFCLHQLGRPADALPLFTLSLIHI